MKKVMPLTQILFSVFQYLFLLGFSTSPGNITASIRKTTFKSAYQYIWNNYKIFAQKYYGSTTLSIWIVYTKCVSKNSFASEDVIFYLLWYKLLSWSFFSLILKFLIEVCRITQKIEKVWQIVEWVEKCNYASDILSEWSLT